MPLEEKRKNKINLLAKESIHVIESVAKIAIEKAKLINNQSTTSPFASINTFTDKSSNALATINKENIDSLQVLIKEPVISRVVAINEDGEEKTYYISRTNPSPVKDTDAIFSSYRAPIGRLASIPAGEDLEIEIAGKKQYYEVLEKIIYHPKKDSNRWDSVNNIFESVDDATITIKSFVKQLASINNEDDIHDFLSDVLKENDNSDNIHEGIRRNVINSMSLRDQPILDREQDKIFRLPLETQLLIVGPPGTGKTTTLIRRLGQKLDMALLPKEEQELTERFNTQLPHETSWLMFTPTELLKQYVKEAFSREGVPASESRIKTWDDYRRHLARNVVGILKSSAGGSLVLSDSNSMLTDSALNDSILWYESFSTYFHSQVMLQLKDSLLWLQGNYEASEIIEIAEKIKSILGEKRTEISISTLKSIDKLNNEIAIILKKYQKETTEIIRKNLNLLLNTDKEFLKNLSDYMLEIKNNNAKLQAESSDTEEDDDDDDTFSKNELTKDYNFAIRALARAKSRNKKLNIKSKSHHIISWLGDNLPSEDQLMTLGTNLELQTHLRRFSNPVKYYTNQTSTKYRAFKRECIKTDKPWYKKGKTPANYVSPLELDIILLLSLKNINSFLSAYSQTELETSLHLSSIATVIGEYRNQILVDEATDFSPIQLACMLELTNPKMKSFFACGDFNQRITTWGTQTKEQMSWVSPRFDVRKINISYRQSKELNQLANLITKKADTVASIPEYAESIATQPVLAENMGDIEDLSNWLKNRINEIEIYVESLPSIAIFVHNEESVQPITDILNEKLVENNIRVVSCPQGRVMGQDSDIRVFDIQHIKGLEFEAVFFIGVDILAEKLPTLFEKYLYVGITRAATYLGITCSYTLPEKIKHSRKLFTATWQQN
ncbi:MAG: ATP-binding domain-containing protein [Sulfurovaceae bacterium]|nr:ATP-binding domain-containing protein [Sulfurovaceae bacterium]